MAQTLYSNQIYSGPISNDMVQMMQPASIPCTPSPATIYYFPQNMMPESQEQHSQQHHQQQQQQIYNETLQSYQQTELSSEQYLTNPNIFVQQSAPQFNPVTYMDMQQNLFFQQQQQQQQAQQSPLPPPQQAQQQQPTPQIQTSPIPLQQAQATPQMQGQSNYDYLTALENDPYFIPVQGILPPSKNLEGRYECQMCDRSYTHAKHLKRHMMRHTGQKPYGCSWCSAKFTRPDIRKRHVSKCKVRRKMEGMEIKIEKEDPAKMISLRNNKKAAGVTKKAVTPKKKTTATSPKRATSTTSSPAIIPSTTPASSTNNTPSTSPALQSKGTQENTTVSYIAPPSNFVAPSTVTPPPTTPIVSETETKKSVQQQQHDMAAYLQSMPTPLEQAQNVGYLTPAAEPSPVDYEHKTEQQQDLCFQLYPQTNTTAPSASATAPNYGIGIFVCSDSYDPSIIGASNPSTQSIQVLTPNQFAVGNNNGAQGYSFESPLETFVPPMYS